MRPDLDVVPERNYLSWLKLAFVSQLFHTVTPLQGTATQLLKVRVEIIFFVATNMASGWYYRGARTT